MPATDIKDFRELILALRKTNNRKEKEFLVEQYRLKGKNAESILNTLGSDPKYQISSARITVHQCVEYNGAENMDLSVFLETLVAQEHRGRGLYKFVGAFIFHNSEYKYFLLSTVIDKDYNCGYNFCREKPFSVAKGHSFNGDVDSLQGTWFASRKLDGLRVVAKKYSGGKTRLYSSSGKIIESVPYITDELDKLPIDSFAIDGELCYMSNGEDKFNKISGASVKKTEVYGASYHVFDLLSVEDFDTRRGKMPLSKRLEYLDMYIKSMKKPFRFVEVVRQLDIKKYPKAFLELLTNSINSNWEGLILRKDAPYIGDRSKDILKIKHFSEDGEFTVIDVTVGIIQGILMVSALVIVDPKDKNFKPTNVGTGISMEQRIAWEEDKSLVLGKQVTIKYLNRTTNKKTKETSLRHPVFKCIREDV